MQLVWHRDGAGTVRDLFDEMRQERAIAYTTVMSTMDNLHRKGWLNRVKDGKAYRYTATASREEYSARLMREALAGGGDTEAVLIHFVAQMDGEESEVLGAIVRRRADSKGQKARGGPRRWWPHGRRRSSGSPYLRSDDPGDAVSRGGVLREARRSRRSRPTGTWP